MKWKAYVLAAVTSAFACDLSLYEEDVFEDSTPTWQLRQPRILAVQTDPPVQFPSDGLTTATMHALIIDSDAEPVTPALRWRVCNPWVEVLDPRLDCSGDDAVTLSGDTLDSTAVLTRFPEPAWNENGLGPRPTRVGLPVVLETEVEGQSLVAIRRLDLYLREPTYALPLDNPEQRGLDVPGVSPVGSYEPNLTHQLFVEARFAPELGDILAQDADVYAYVTGGKLITRHARLYTMLGEHGDTVRFKPIDWTAPESGPVTLWFVIIDSNGGRGWLQTKLVPVDRRAGRARDSRGSPSGAMP